ncbi:MAG: minor capsid protein [Tissierellia bacterium]|nr:minor capsid protein [Tissierellia bacterium]
MKNDYWGKRLANEYWNIYNDTSKYQKELIKLYKKANEEILAELYKITAKFEENGVISRSEFYKAEHLKRMEKGFNDVLRELGEKVEDKGSKIILNAGKDVILATGGSLGVDINYNEDLAKKLLQTNWKGSNFSKRVWKNSKKLENELNTQVKKGILMGKPTAQIAMELDKSMNVGLSNSARLVRTETMHHMNDVNLQHMKSNGVKQVEEVVTLDERTSSTCKVHNKKIHDIEKAPILPRHPNCRCVLVPYINVDKLAKEFDKGEKGTVNEAYNHEDLSSEKYNKLYINLQFFAKNKHVKNYTLSEFRERKFQRDVKIGKINTLGKIKEKMITDELIVTRERIDHILMGHEDIKDITLSDLKNIISAPENIIKDDKNEGTYIFYKPIDDVYSLGIVIKLLKNSSQYKFGKRNTVLTVYKAKTKRFMEKTLIKS